jgi:hypothetical protein
MGNFLVKITLFGWIPFVLALFTVLTPRRAVIWAFLLAWLFLPMAGFGVPGLPDYTKMSATTAGVLIGALIFDTDRILGFRLKWIDLPMVLWCTSPFVSSYLNDLGMYDGVAEVVHGTIIWGLPYIIGRVYFADLEGLRELAIGMFIGGLIYVPLCLFEVRFSPQLHVWVYGYHQHSFYQNVRDGGFRPMVFMQHGLMVAMWMGMTALIGVWLWQTKALKQVWDIPMYYLVPAMLATVYLCKSKYALLLLMTGVGLLYLSKWMRTSILVVLLALIPPTYTYLRASGAVTGEKMVEVAKQTFGEERSKSLFVRVDNENALVQKAMERPWFGWGGWGRARVTDDDGKDRITDSLWIITIGKAGWVGLIALMSMLLLPMLLVCKDWKTELWSHPAVAPVVVLGMITMLYMFDHLMNGMVNPIFMLVVGAIGSAHYILKPAPRQAMPVMMGQRPPMYPQPSGPARPVQPQGFRAA